MGKPYTQLIPHCPINAKSLDCPYKFIHPTSLSNVVLSNIDTPLPQLSQLGTILPTPTDSLLGLSGVDEVQQSEILLQDMPDCISGHGWQPEGAYRLLLHSVSII